MTVGTEIADLTVCGAVPPYNALLAGKLVAMLAVSPEVVLEYKRRYQTVPSIIASSMAGRAVVRPANLVFIETTSLYGERPNQYDRTSYPCSIVGGPANESIRYKYLTGLEKSRTSGVGTFQFGRDTKAAIVFCGHLALQLLSLEVSESMGNHDSEIMDASRVD